MITEIISYQKNSNVTIPLVSSPVTAGFPSPAEDYLDTGIDLNEHLIKHPAATFLVRVKGDSMQGAGIADGDLLVVDRAEKPRSGSIVVAVLDNEFTVKRLKLQGRRALLLPENPHYQPVDITNNEHASIWGVIRHVIHTPQ